MTRLFVTPSCAALTLLSFLFVSQASAQDDPVQVFRECAREIRTTARVCVNQNDNNADRCVREIRHLLAHGQFELANHVARHCIEAIQNRTDRCIGRINETCERCVRRLLQLDAERLAVRMRVEVCKDARVAVIQSGRRSVRRIQNLFD